MRHSKFQVKIILLGLIHRIYRIARPLVVRGDLARHHVRLARVHLKGVDIVLDLLQPVLNSRYHLGRRIVHDLLEIGRIVRIIPESVTREQLGVQRAHRRKIALAHAVLDGDAPPVCRIREHIPRRCLLAGHQIGIVDNTRHAPHKSRRISAPRLAVYLVIVKYRPQIRRYTLYIIIIFIVLIEKCIRQRHRPILADELHEHILRRTYQIVGIPQREHVVEILIRAECRIFHIDLHAVGLLIPCLKVVYHRIFAEDIAGLQIYDFVLVPAALVDILLPAAYAQRHGLARRRGIMRICCLRRYSLSGRNIFLHLRCLCLLPALCRTYLRAGGIRPHTRICSTRRADRMKRRHAHERSRQPYSRIPSISSHLPAPFRPHCADFCN